MKKEIMAGLAWAGVMLALALAGVCARNLGFMDRDTVTRLLFAVIGLWMVWNGNLIPKRLAPNACARQAQRVSAWSMILSGLVYAALWLLAPMSVALWGGVGAVLAGMAITFGFCLSLRTHAKAG